MSLPAYHIAARRHLRDAEFLLGIAPGQPAPGEALPVTARLESADHLLGFAAECAIAATLATVDQVKNAFNPDGSLMEQYKGHIHERGKIRSQIRLLERGRHGVLHGGLKAMFEKEKSFEGWHVQNRYLADGHVNGEQVLAHLTSTRGYVAVLEKAESYKRPRT